MSEMSLTETWINKIIDEKTAPLRAEVARIVDLKEYYLKKYDEQFDRADKAEAEVERLNPLGVSKREVALRDECKRALARGDAYLSELKALREKPNEDHRNVEECWIHLVEMCEIESREEWEKRHPGQALSMAVFASLFKRDTKAEAEVGRLRAALEKALQHHRDCCECNGQSACQHETPLDHCPDCYIRAALGG